jgi:hypothetical protein
VRALARTTLSAAALGALALVPLAGAAQAATPAAVHAVARTASFNSCGYSVTVDGLRVRKTAGGVATGQLYKGDWVKATRTSGSWAYVTVLSSRGSLRYPATGWVSWSYLRAEACTTSD